MVFFETTQIYIKHLAINWKSNRLYLDNSQALKIILISHYLTNLQRFSFTATNEIDWPQIDISHCALLLPRCIKLGFVISDNTKGAHCCLYSDKENAIHRQLSGMGVATGYYTYILSYCPCPTTYNKLRYQVLHTWYICKWF